MAERSRKGVEKGISKRNDGRASARSRCLFGSNEEVSSCTKVARYQGRGEEYAGQLCQKMKTVGNFKDFQFKTFFYFWEMVFISTIFIFCER